MATDCVLFDIEHLYTVNLLDLEMLDHFGVCNPTELQSIRSNICEIMVKSIVVD